MGNITTSHFPVTFHPTFSKPTKDSTMLSIPSFQLETAAYQLSVFPSLMHICMRLSGPWAQQQCAAPDHRELADYQKRPVFQ